MAKNKLGIFDGSFQHWRQACQVLDLVAGENKERVNAIVSFAISRYGGEHCGSSLHPTARSWTLHHHSGVRTHKIYHGPRIGPIVHQIPENPEFVVGLCQCREEFHVSMDV